MHTRHLVTKHCDGDIESYSSSLYNGVQLGLAPSVKTNALTVSDTSLERVPISKVQDEMIIGKGIISENPLCKEIMLDKSGECRPLSQIFDYQVKPDSTFADDLIVGIGFDSLFYYDAIKDFLVDIAYDMFKNDTDLEGSEEMLKYAPLAVLTGVLTLQTDAGGSSYLNPNGTVTIAEFLDSLNAINYGCNANRTRKRSIDLLSDEKDYFNEGYNSCLVGISSPFYRLYKRSELLKPITRIELAYITVICWTKFIEQYNGVAGGTFDLGICFDWENPASYLEVFEDGFDYKISKAIFDAELPVMSLNLKDYKKEHSMSEFLYRIKQGVQAIPYPALMSMLEINQLGLFPYEGRLDPLREVSRLELCYFATNLAKLFKTHFIY